MDKQQRVIVVGAGPVGLVVALRLVRAGFSVHVLEEASALHSEPRASTVHCSTLDLLETLDLGRAVVESGRPAPLWQYRMWETGEAAVFDMSVLADETAFPFRLQCEQFKLATCVAHRLSAEAPSAICFGVKATAVEQSADEARVTVEQNGIVGTMAADWVIGCDGASSAMRIGLGLSFEGETYPVPNIAVATPFDFEGLVPGLLNVNYFWSERGSFSMFHTKDMWRVGYSPPAGMSDTDAISSANVEAQLQRILPHAETYPISTARHYRIHQRIASTFHVGRVLLAGDAAHLNTPSGGFGMNGGIHDAFALTDALIAVARGADGSVLDRYSRRRRSAALADIQSTAGANYKRHREPDPARRRAALAELQAIAADRTRLKTFLMESSLITSWRRSEAVA